MELGFNFDEDDFAGGRQKKSAPLSYNAKICGPKWFLDDISLEGPDDKATVWKLRADYYFNNQEYAKAANCYQQSLDSLGAQNRSMRREVVESMSRCYIHTGNLIKALEYSEKMASDCLTTAHICQALILQQQIHRSAGNTLEEIEVLHHLIQLHSFHFPFWSCLAEAYSTHSCSQGNKVSHQLSELKLSGQYQNKEGPKKEARLESGVIAESEPNSTQNTNALANGDVIEESVQTDIRTQNLCSEVKDDSSETPQKTCDFENHHKHDKLFGYPRKLLILTCLVRVKLILQSNCRNVGTFIKDRHLQRLKETEERIKSITSDDHTLKAVTEFMRSDMYDDGLEETLSDENIDIKSGEQSPIHTEEFVKKWYSWIQHL